MKKTYSYIRVSTKDQNEDRQLLSMEELHIPDKNIFIDKQSGKDFNRPQYKRLLRKLKKTICSLSKALTGLDGTTVKYWNNGEFLPKRKALIL